MLNSVLSFKQFYIGRARRCEWQQNKIQENVGLSVANYGVQILGKGSCKKTRLIFEPPIADKVDFISLDSINLERYKVIFVNLSVHVQKLKYNLVYRLGRVED